HHAETLPFRVFLDRVADVAQGRARADHTDAAEQRLAGGLHQPPGHHRWSADVVHAAGVAVPDVVDDGDVVGDDVAVTQHRGIAGDAVADDVVGRDSGGPGIPLVAEVGGGSILHVYDVVVADAVENQGAHAGAEVYGLDLQQLGRKAPGE